MEMSIREARTRFSEAIAAVMRGERVVITRDGQAVAEMNPPSPPLRDRINWEAGEAYRKEHGLDKFEGQNLWPLELDDPAFSRKVLGLED